MALQAKPLPIVAVGKTPPVVSDSCSTQVCVFVLGDGIRDFCCSVIFRLSLQPALPVTGFLIRYFCNPPLLFFRFATRGKGVRIQEAMENFLSQLDEQRISPDRGLLAALQQGEPAGA